MARPRSALYKSLPPNLFYDALNKQYRYRRPDIGSYHWMGRDKIKVISAAKQLNSMYMEGQDLVAQVSGQTQTLGKYLDDYFASKHLPRRKLSKTTLKDYNNKMIHIKENLGKKPINEIHVRDIAGFLNDFPPILSNRFRSLLSLIFKYAIADGFAEDNPAAKTMNQQTEKKRTRLSLEGFLAIRHFEDPKWQKGNDDRQWLKNAMDLGLLTLQRREDIVNMKFEDIKTETHPVTGETIEYLYVIQKKTEKHGECAFIKIKIGPDLKAVIKRCRDNIPSPYLIHRNPNRRLKSQEKTHPTQILPDFLSHEIAEIRDQLPLFKKMPLEQRPAFHEIRSLGIKLYENAGVDAQKLAGHSDRAMTEKYKAGHEIAWTEAEATLPLLSEQNTL